MIFLPVQKFFFGQHDIIFFHNLTLGYISVYFFFPPPESEYFFQQHWESEYLFRKKS